MSKKNLRLFLAIGVLVALLAGAAIVAAQSVKKAPQSKGSKPSRHVLMLGRSVMSNWFDYWGSNPAKKGRFTLYYGQLESPPDIAKSAKTRISAFKKPNPIVFFKLCFADFEGGSLEEAKTNLNRNVSYVKEVHNYVTKRRGAKLIVGNALPQVSANTTSYLVWNHRHYNQWLWNYAKKYKDRVSVLNMYGALSDRNGNLSQAYATSPDDSRPNTEGYKALDKPLFKLLSGY